MKIWWGYGSEHSMNLVMIGRFKSVEEAEKAKQLIDLFTERIVADVQAGLLCIGEPTDRYSEGILDFLRQVKFYNIGTSELEQFAYGDIHVKLRGNEIRITTDEFDVSAFLKILIEKGAKVEIYSAHDYSES